MDPISQSAIARAQAALRIATQPAPRTAPRPNMARALRAAAEDGPLHGEDRESFEEAAREAGKPFDRYSMPVRWEWLRGQTRDLSVAAGGGAYLVGEQVPGAFDALRPWSVTAQGGIQVLENLQGTVTLPVTSATSTPMWLANETTSTPHTAPTITGIALVPKVVIVELEFSQLLWKLAPALLDSYVMREIGRTLGVGVDAAVISGEGTDGAPLGVVNVGGIGSTSGTGFGNAAAAEMLRKVSVGNGADASTAWLAVPAVRELLQKRERVADTGVFVWDADKILNRPAYAPSVGVPAETVVLADWSRVVLGLWGTGVALTVTPYASAANFKAGIISAQARLTCDVAALSPSAICVASSIT